MSILIWILIVTFLDSLLGLIGIFSLWIKEELLNKLLAGLVAFSAGALLGGAFFHLLEESLENLSAMTSFIYVIIGFVLFLLMEGYFHWHHCEKCTVHPFTYLMLVGDGIHNFIDGLVMAAAFYVDVRLGIITSLVIIAHEAPQEIGLFGVLIYGGFKKKKALLYSFLAQATCMLGGIVGFLASLKIKAVSPFLIPFAAGGFIYIAASDLVPEMHKMYKGKLGKSIETILIFIVGILLMLGLKLLV